jgi:hypothetical protein
VKRIKAFYVLCPGRRGGKIIAIIVSGYDGDGAAALPGADSSQGCIFDSPDSGLSLFDLEDDSLEGRTSEPLIRQVRLGFEY